MPSEHLRRQSQDDTHADWDSVYLLAILSGLDLSLSLCVRAHEGERYRCKVYILGISAQCVCKSKRDAVYIYAGEGLCLGLFTTCAGVRVGDLKQTQEHKRGMSQCS